MQTLADLKRDCSNYKWSLKENSWFRGVPVFQAKFREVGHVQSNRFTLLTDKLDNGELTESWIDFPKAKELQLIALGDDRYTVIIKSDCGNNPVHIMIYELHKRV